MAASLHAISYFLLQIDLLSIWQQAVQGVRWSVAHLPSVSKCSYAFMLSEIARPLLDLDPHGGINLLGMFPFFLKRTDVQALSVVFRRLLHLGSFTACWREVNILPQFRKDQITPMLPTMNRFLWHQSCLRYLSDWWRFISDDLWYAVVCFHTQFVFWKRLGTSVALICVSLSLQSALESWQEARIVQIDFRVGFDRVYRQGILCELCFVGIGGSVLSILTVSIKSITTHSGGRLSL